MKSIDINVIRAKEAEVRGKGVVLLILNTPKCSMNTAIHTKT